MTNPSSVLVFHLQEAMEAIQSLIEEIKEGESDEDELRTDVAHIYHHINAGWNGRAMGEEYWHKDFPDDEGASLNKMPSDIADVLADWYGPNAHG